MAVSIKITERQRHTDREEQTRAMESRGVHSLETYIHTEKSKSNGEER